MKNNSFRKYYLLCLLGVLVVSFYPLYMGVQVVSDMLRAGTVLAENYPKYIIPYTPISLAVILGVALMPLAMRCTRQYALLSASVVSLETFFLSELLLESQVIVTTTVATTLESWQMYMCAIVPKSDVTRTYTAVDILIGEYSPAFKLHFYAISVVLILSLLNGFYGFGQMILSGDRKRLKPLILQSISGVLFLGLCILACFTAFFRNGELQVSALSAVLMILFFVVFGATMGIYCGSFTMGRRSLWSVWIPAAVACIVTVVMYIGELILLSGHLYRFGSGRFFSGLGALVLAPADVLVVLLSGAVTAGVLCLVGRKKV